MIAGAAAWRPMQQADLGMVERVGTAVHADLDERPSILAERLALFPAGCWVTDGGYAIAHPSRLGEPPALDTLLGALPEDADTLHVHDVALLPAMRGLGLGGTVLKAITGTATRLGLGWISLVAVHGTPPYWARFGFAEAPAAPSLASYGPAARYMARRVMP
jgi:GNAT superfamily N-acetyltransferase